MLLMNVNSNWIEKEGEGWIGDFLKELGLSI